eukprot:182842-Rhodomonas_salina.3
MTTWILLGTGCAFAYPGTCCMHCAMGNLTNCGNTYAENLDPVKQLKKISEGSPSPRNPT